MTDLKEFQRFEQQQRISFSDEGPLLETLKFFEISFGSYKPLSSLPEIKKVGLL